jgi:phosphate transport system permease protein
VLFWILGMLVKGIGGLSSRPSPTVTPGPGSGRRLLNAIVGSLVLTFLGIASARRSACWPAPGSPSTAATRSSPRSIRFINDILLSAPSILIGLFVYEIMVEPFRGFSGWAGGVALASSSIPVVVRTTEDMLQPRARHAARGRAGARRPALRHDHLR